MIIRDLTGRYVWDTQLEPNLVGKSETKSFSLDKTDGFVLRQDVRIKSSDEM